MFCNYAATRSVFSTDPILDKIIRGAKKHDEYVVEIIDNESSDGSQLLTNILVNSVLPQAHGGSSVNVFYFDLNQHFDFLRLVSAMEEKTKAAEMEIKDWMKKFHIVRCSDMEQLVITLYSIEPLIANSKIPVKLIILDGLSTFYWNEQCAGGFSRYLREQNYKRLVKVLESFTKKYNLSVLIRSLEVFGPVKKENEEFSLDPRNLQLYGDFWNDFVTHRFILEKKLFTTDTSTSENVSSSFALKCLIPESYKVEFSIASCGLVE